MSPVAEGGSVGEMEAYLRACVPELLPGRPAVCAIAPYTDDVWRIDTDDGRRLVVKHQLFGLLTRGRDYDLLTVEREVLGLLRSEGCAVPEVLGIDEEAQCIFLQWVGDTTLDEAIQAGDGVALRQAIEGLCAIERVCTRHVDVLAARVVPMAGTNELKMAWADAGRRAVDGVEKLSRRLGGAGAVAGVVPLLEDMHRWLAAREPALGSTDYNARNAVIGPDGTGVHFLEFAKIGWDWTERRLVQYTTSMGSGREDGRMRSLLDSGAAHFYAEVSGRADGARALDYHNIFFLLNGAALLCAALDGEPRLAALLARWKRPEKRLRQLADLLVRGLSADLCATEFRARLNAGVLSASDGGGQ